ncbi:SH3 domain-containing protein [Xanthomonas translucens]|uniref:SH3 domain-containing protein n=2 Tax=Xanthomonas campestris pv. translucens TaxID=343 RepID=UPI0009B7B08B|nr:SH3 domain-containing protein [Xanthomonas translucens pv. undulosa]UKE40782.1 SH3 domain-containing protein [Xanthomonas translucens pv. undulosa]UKE44483.1 SH3 domain-containing protein [Xanthomonas translucens pv. secalis]
MARKSGGGSLLILLVGIGWVMSKCGGPASNNTPDRAPPSSSLAIATPAVSSTETMFVNAAVLNQRSSPDGSVVGKASGGDSVNVYERRGNWARVSPDNSAQLWVSRSHLCSGAGCYSPALPRTRSRAPPKPSRSNYSDGTCPCSGNRVCIGPRGGRYCITSGGNKRYGV